MKLGVISDAHGDEYAIRRAIAALPPCDSWLHLGDILSDADTIMELSGKPVYSVRGNCDLDASAEFERTLEFEGVRIYLAHGHRLGVDSGTYRLSLGAQELHCSVALYGHTHISSLENDGYVLLMNPGSPSRPRGGRKPSIALLELEKGDVTGASIITL